MAESALQPKTRQGTKVMRRGWTPPLWVNVAFGVAMLVFGVYFSLVQTGIGPGGKLLLLLAYCAVSGFYLARAYRQYRAKQSS